MKIGILKLLTMHLSDKPIRVSIADETLMMWCDSYYTSNFPKKMQQYAKCANSFSSMKPNLREE